jgi:hypothetical protein
MGQVSEQPNGQGSDYRQNDKNEENQGEYEKTPQELVYAPGLGGKHLEKGRNRRRHDQHQKSETRHITKSPKMRIELLSVPILQRACFRTNWHQLRTRKLIWAQRGSKPAA